MHVGGDIIYIKLSCDRNLFISPTELLVLPNQRSLKTQYAYCIASTNTYLTALYRLLILDTMKRIEFLYVDGALFRFTTGKTGEAEDNSFISHESNTVHLKRLLYHVQTKPIHTLDF